MSRPPRPGSRPRPGGLRWLSVVAALLVASGCGQNSSHHGPAGPAAAALPVLAASAVPGIPAVTARLTAADLAKDAAVHGLAAKITAWGYLGGRQRTFQGESHRLTLVVSRALMFRGTAGARSYAAFVRAHRSAFFGTATGARPLPGSGGSGWLFTPQLCACHMANPALIGVVNAGPRVLWLEINGPAATPALLVRLLGDAGH
jgi:hypothetical protein